MASPTFSTSVTQLNWVKLLTILGDSPATQALPALVTCPCCRTPQLWIFWDGPGAGQWQWCRKCQQGGDLLSLVQRAWKLDLATTVARLRREGIAVPPMDSTEYTDRAQQLGKYVRFENLWQQSRSLPNVRQAAAGRLFANAGVNYADMGDDWLSTGPCQFVGCEDADVVQRVFHPESTKTYKQQTSRRVNNPSSTRLFSGRIKEWQHVLVLPYYDLPGRLRNLQFIGRQCRPGEDYVARAIARPWAADLGITFHPGILGNNDPVVCLPDTATYLSWQLRHHRLQRMSLPLVNWFENNKGCPTRAWSLLGGRRLVFWNPKLTAELLRQAIVADGWISLPSLRPDLLEQQLRTTPPHALLPRFVQQAKPWVEVLSQFVLEQEQAEIDNLLWLLRSASVNFERVLSACSGRVLQRLRELWETTDNRRGVLLRRRFVEETTQGWLTAGEKQPQESELISSALLRIEQVVRFSQSAKLVYTGKILFNEQAYPFAVDKTVLDTKGFGWVQQQLLQSNAGLMEFAPDWKNDAVALAFRFHKPRLTEGLEQVGWAPSQHAFLFPGFRISASGQTKPMETVSLAGYVPACQVPAPRDDFTSGDISLICRPTPSLLSAWCAWLGLLQNIVAPMLQQDTTGICVDHEFWPAAEAAVAAMGCQRVSLDNLVAARSTERQHNYPICLNDTGGELPALCEFLQLTDRPRNCLFAAHRLLASTLSLLPSWLVLTGNSRGDDLDDFAATGGQLLPQFLTWLRQGRTAALRTDDWVASLRQSVFSWLRQLKVDEQFIAAFGRQWLTVSRHSFLRLLASKFCHGELEALPPEFAEERTLWLFPDEQTIFLPRRVIARLFDRYSPLGLDNLGIFNNLREHGFRVVETVRCNQVGWELPYDQWSREVRQYGNQLKRQLRIAT